MTSSSLREELLRSGQEHVLARLAVLEPARRARLERELAALDYDLLRDLARLARAGEGGRSSPSFEPPELFPARRGPEEERRAARARAVGSELLGKGQVGFVLVAGGQASRLGFEAPKGAFPVGPVTGLSLFGFHAHRLGAAARRHSVRVPWYVMTSPANQGATAEFFEQQGFFGLPREDVTFFSQDMLPALDEDGRLLFSAPEALFVAPNGHGGSLLALARSGALEDMRERGIEELSYFQVDNPLARPADPLFLGLHRLAGAGMSSKVVKKRDAAEKVGVIGHVDGKLTCIEYSDLPAELRDAREPGGELAFRAGNIAVHVLSRAFVDELTRAGFELPWHVARKRMSVVEPDGRTVERTGVKFETFVFDALSRSPATVTLEVLRAEEFSPVKNASGVDSPATCRADLCRLFEKWVRAAGLPLPPPDDQGNLPIEVDPLFAETQDEFLAAPARAGRLEPDVRPTGHLYA